MWNSKIIHENDRIGGKKHRLEPEFWGKNQITLVFTVGHYNITVTDVANLI